MKSPKADLHIHTKKSDGKLAPADIVKKASEKGLCTISITDHDTYAGYFEAKSAGDDLGVEVLPGIEITSEYKDRECHILGYGFDLGNAEFSAFVKSQKLRRYKRARRMIQNLGKMGFDISIEEVIGEAGTMNISRNHLAKVMVSKGMAPNVRVVFDRYLGNRSPAYFKIGYESAEEVIRLIKSAGGISILAHPGLYYVEEDIKYFIEAEIDGFEYIHPSHNYLLQKRYREICEQNGLIATGGSDYHGFRPEDESYFGTVAVDSSTVAHIKRLTVDRKKQHTSQ